MTATSRRSTTPLRKSALVPQPPEDAFRIFVDDIAAWWPLASHSVGRERATAVVFEHGLGGRIVETYGDGDTAVWGTVTAWDPPNRVRFSWHPGTPEPEATEVEVTFIGDRHGGTRVELTHSGWDNRPDGADARSSYDSGWDLVFGAYAHLAAGALT
ncbi:MAG: SRPBCC family protein [Acidimicrobiales bacterium]